MPVARGDERATASAYSLAVSPRAGARTSQRAARLPPSHAAAAARRGSRRRNSSRYDAATPAAAPSDSHSSQPETLAAGACGALVAGVAGWIAGCGRAGISTDGGAVEAELTVAGCKPEEAGPKTAAPP